MKTSVLFVDHDRGRSGATVSMEYLIRAFSGAGCTVFVLSPKKSRDAARLADAGATVLGLNIPGMNSLSLDLHFSHTVSPLSLEGVLVLAKNAVKFIVGTVVICRVARRVHAGLVYVNEYVVIQGSVAGFICGIPSVIHIRSLMLRGAFGLRRRILAFLTLACNRKVFAITPLEAEQIAGSKTLREKIAVVGEFVDAADMQASDGRAWRAAIGVHEEQVLVSMVGGIDPVKGSLEYLRCAEKVHSSRPDTVFALAGTLDGEGSRAKAGYYEECMRIVAALREAGALLVLGFLDDIGSMVAGSDILVVPSALTHFSRPVIEAWACAKPVVVSATEHMRNLVTDERDGLFFPVGDAGEMARVLLRLIDNKDMRGRLGREGEKKARSLFDARRNTGSILSYCRSLSAEFGMESTVPRKNP